MRRTPERKDGYQTQAKYIQCVEPIMGTAEAEAVAVYKDRDRDWGSIIQPSAPAVRQHLLREEGNKTVPGVARETEEKSEEQPCEYTKEDTLPTEIG